MTDLWGLVWGKPQIDPRLLAEAVERAAVQPRLDYRTRLLIRDSTDALKRYWGEDRLRDWLRHSPARERIEAICCEPFDEPGFPLLEGALVERTEPDTVRQYLRELGGHLRHPARLVIGGSIALILPGHLTRVTQDIDVVDEVPAELRQQHEVLDDLARRYRLHLTHFQSHFLPAGWEQRVHTLEPFGKLQAALVDVVDVFLGKLFSPRSKDLDDLRLLLPALNRETLLRRLKQTCGGFLTDSLLRGHGERNWYILTGETLPGGT